MRKHKHSKKFAKMFLGAAGDDAPRAISELEALTNLYLQSYDFKSLLMLALTINSP